MTSSQVIKYTPPKAIESKKLNFSELGEGKIDDFSDNNNYKYTDYKKAHINNYLIDPDNSNNKSYSSLEELKKDREESKELTPEMWEAIEREKEYKKEREWERENRLKERDRQISDQYSTINKLMLNR